MKIITEIKQYPARYLFLAIFLIILLAIIFDGDDGNNAQKTSNNSVEKKSEVRSIPAIPQPQAPEKQASSPEPRLLGKWFGKRNVYLGGDDLKYMATFDPPLPVESVIIPPVSSDPIYPYMVNLLNEVWGLLPSQLSNPQIQSPLIVYEDLAGNKYAFLVMKDESTREIYAVGFWKE